jgi:hypothetical protein
MPPTRYPIQVMRHAFVTRCRGAAATECLVDKNGQRAHNSAGPGKGWCLMAHLIFRCDQTDFVIMTGIEMEPEAFERLHPARSVQCRLCGQGHVWEIVERIPNAALLMSRAAKDCLRRSLLSDANAARAIDTDVRALYERMAGRWFRLAVAPDQPARPEPGVTALESLLDRREQRLES